MLNIDWYIEHPLDFEYKNYILLDYIQSVDKATFVSLLTVIDAIVGEKILGGHHDSDHQKDEQEKVQKTKDTDKEPKEEYQEETTKNI
jgi:hypothetical protein